MPSTPTGFQEHRFLFRWKPDTQPDATRLACVVSVLHAWKDPWDAMMLIQGRVERLAVGMLDDPFDYVLECQLLESGSPHPADAFLLKLGEGGNRPVWAGP